MTLFRAAANLFANKITASKHIQIENGNELLVRKKNHANFEWQRWSCAYHQQHKHEAMIEHLAVPIVRLYTKIAPEKCFATLRLIFCNQWKWNYVFFFFVSLPTHLIWHAWNIWTKKLVSFFRQASFDIFVGRYDLPNLNLLAVRLTARNRILEFVAQTRRYKDFSIKTKPRIWWSRACSVADSFVQTHQHSINEMFSNAVNYLLQMTTSSINSSPTLDLLADELAYASPKYV